MPADNRIRLLACLHEPEQGDQADAADEVAQRGDQHPDHRLGRGSAGQVEADEDDGAADHRVRQIGREQHGAGWARRWPPGGTAGRP